MARDDTNQAALQALLDKQEIHEVLMRYCRGIDRCDAELLRDIYHPDATDDHGMFKGKAGEFIPWALEALKREENTTHLIGNELVEIDGDVAYCESYFSAVHRRIAKDGTPLDLRFDGRYVDRFERRQGKWKIAHRQVVFDRSRLDPVGKIFSTDEFVCGRRSREDAVYKR